MVVVRRFAESSLFGSSFLGEHSDSNVAINARAAPIPAAAKLVLLELVTKPVLYFMTSLRLKLVAGSGKAQFPV